MASSLQSTNSSEGDKLFESVARRVKEECTKGSDFKPGAVNESLVDTVSGVGESVTRKSSVGSNKST